MSGVSGESATASDYGAAALELGLTRDLSAYVSGLKFEDLAAEVAQAARRGVLDWLGCALAGSAHPTIDRLCAVLSEAGSPGNVPVFGRSEKLSLLEAPLANGQMGHLLDYDDTHMGGVVLHTSSPVLAALFALCEREQRDGKTLLAAYVAAFDAGVRAGQSAPDHHPGGWHLTGTLGSIAAGAGAARLLELDAQQTVHALGIATTQAGGMQQNRGTMCKSFHAGKAAHNGVLAALLARRGFDSSDEILDGKRGFCRIYSASAAPERLTDGLGERYEIAANGFKPYACGVVLHPAIDVMIDLGRQGGADGEAVESAQLKVHPAAVTITGVADPKTGLKSKFSLYHSAAVAYLDGTAGVAQYSDERAVAPDVVALRGKVIVHTDDSLEKDQAEATVKLKDGRELSARVEHATGTVGNPMSDAAIEAKFLANAEPALGADRAGRVRDLVWGIEALPDVRELTALLSS